MFLLLFTIPVVGVRFINTEPVLINPDLYEARNALRANPEVNGYGHLLAALQLFPQKPPYYTLIEDGYEVSYMPHVGSVGERLKIMRPDDDPLLRQYIKDLEAVFDEIDKALQKDHILYRMPGVVNWEFATKLDYDQMVPLFLAMSGAAQAEFILYQNPLRGVEQLNRMFHLQRALSVDMEYFSGHLIREPLDMVRYVAFEVDDPQTLRILANYLIYSPPPYAEPQVVLDRIFNRIDNSIMYPETGHMPRDGMTFNVRLTIWRFQRTAKFLLKPKNDMSALIYRSPIDYVVWEEERNLGGINVFNNVERYMITSILGELMQAQYAHAHFIASRILVAAKLYKLEFGAFPQTLEDLVPEFLPDLPPPAWGDMPYVYRNHGDYFELSADGYTTIDFWGDVRKPKPIMLIDKADFVKHGLDK